MKLARFCKKSPCGSRSGFTLIELLVYMAIVGIVILVAGQAFKDSTSMKIRTQNMLKASQEVESAANLIIDDVAQMGAKVSENGKWSGEYIKYKEVFIDPENSNEALKDYSSFVLKKGSAPYDSLYFRTLRYDGEGKFVGLDEVSWYVTDTLGGKRGKLMRKCRRIKKNSGASDDPLCPEKDGSEVMIADSISRFEIIPAKPNTLTSATNKVIFPVGEPTEFRLVSRYDGENFYRMNTTPFEGGSSVELSNFISNYVDGEEYSESSRRKANQLYAAEASADAGNWSTLCAKMNLEKGLEYEISFSMPLMLSTDFSQAFVPGVDHMAVGIRKSNGEKIPRWRDFLFYPPEGEMASDVNRSFRFSVEDNLNDACLVFTFAFYTPLVSVGKMTISNLQVRKVLDANYTFDKDFKLDQPSDIPDKKLIRAFQLNLEVSRHGEKGSVRHVISTPSNGAGAN